jgi:oligosaccharide repeat unit polymerase
MSKFRLYSFVFGFFTFVLFLFILPYSVFSEHQLLLVLSFSVLIFIVILGLFTGVYNFTGTLFLFNLFLLTQFAAVIIPLLFNEYPSFIYFDDQISATEYFIKYMFVILFGFIFLVMGYSKGKSISISKSEISNMEFTGLIVYVPFFISLICFFMVFKTAGGIFNTLSLSAERFEAFSAASGFLAFTKIGYITSVLLICRAKFKSALITFIIITILMGLVGERGAVLFSGVVPVLVAYTLRFKTINKSTSILLIFIFVLFYSIIGALREGGTDDSLSNSAIKIVKNTAHHHIAASTIRLADDEGYWMGEGLFNIIYAPIPRSIWPNKPIIAESGAVGIALKKSSEVNGVGLPPGNFAYSYLQYGMLGVVILSFLSGLFAGIVERYFLSTWSVFNIVLYTQIQGLVFFVFSTEIQMKVITVGLPLLLILFTSKLFSLAKSK